MGKSARKPVLAAGGIVVRDGVKPRLAIVQRRRDNAWVLPKGKLKPNEKPIVAAKREAVEETGSDVRVHEFLGVISYRSGAGPKIAHFWRMQAVGDADGKLMDDIRAVEWLSLAEAIERLSLSHEQTFLRSVGRKALKRALKKARPKKRLDKRAEKAVEKVEKVAAPAPRPVVPAVEVAPPSLESLPSAAAPPLVENVPALLDTAPAAPPETIAPSPRLKSAKPQPRWNTFTQLTKRWQTAIGRTRRRAG